MFSTEEVGGKEKSIFEALADHKQIYHFALSEGILDICCRLQKVKQTKDVIVQAASSESEEVDYDESQGFLMHLKHTGRRHNTQPRKSNLGKIKVAEDEIIMDEQILEQSKQQKDQFKVMMIEVFDEYQLEHAVVLKILQNGFLVEDAENIILMIEWSNSKWL